MLLAFHGKTSMTVLHMCCGSIPGFRDWKISGIPGFGNRGIAGLQSLLCFNYKAHNEPAYTTQQFRKGYFGNRWTFANIVDHYCHCACAKNCCHQVSDQNFESLFSDSHFLIRAKNCPSDNVFKWFLHGLRTRSSDEKSVRLCTEIIFTFEPGQLIRS